MERRTGKLVSMASNERYLIGDVVLTRVPYFDVTLPPESVALTPGQIGAIPWATPVWAESPEAIRVGQVFWVIEADGLTMVIDPCCASDDFLRTGPAALDHQDAAFAAFTAAGFDPAAVDIVIMSHLDGIGMNALADAVRYCEQGWSATNQRQRDVDARRETIQRLIAKSDGKLMQGTDPRLTRREGQ